MRRVVVPLLWSLALVAIAATTAAAKQPKVSKIPTVSYVQYGLREGPAQTQTKSNIEIALKMIRLSDIYEYPDLFSFDVAAVPHQPDFSMTLKRMYPPGPQGKSWENPFSTPDGSEQLLLCRTSVKNGTEHILRMAGARIYLIVDGEDPIPALPNVAALGAAAEHFQAVTNAKLAAQEGKRVLGGLVQIKTERRLPPGFYRYLIDAHRKSYNLVNDLNKEILPGFTFQGLLAFPSMVVPERTARIAFYDVTTATDASGNPTEKAVFEFPLEPQQVTMWFDQASMMWQTGSSPTQ